MLYFRHYFNEVKKSEGGRVLLCDDYECLVKGIRTILLLLVDGIVKVLNDV